MLTDSVHKIVKPLRFEDGVGASKVCRVLGLTFEVYPEDGQWMVKVWCSLRPLNESTGAYSMQHAEKSEASAIEFCNRFWQKSLEEYLVNHVSDA